MKKRLVFLNVFFALSMLAAIAAQSLHEIAHYAESQKERHCHHGQQSGKNISHQHVNLDHCHICDFVFANFTSPEIFTFGFKSVPSAIQAPFPNYREIIAHFRGSLFQHRGPPVFSV